MALEYCQGQELDPGIKSGSVLILCPLDFSSIMMLLICIPASGNKIAAMSPQDSLITYIISYADKRILRYELINTTAWVVTLCRHAERIIIGDAGYLATRWPLIGQLVRARVH